MTNPTDTDGEGPNARDGAFAERRKRSSRTLGVVLFAFAALIFLVTLTRLGANVAERPF